MSEFKHYAIRSGDIRLIAYNRDEVREMIDIFPESRLFEVREHEDGSEREVETVF